MWYITCVQQILEQALKIGEMAEVIRKAAHVDDDDLIKSQEELTRLHTENKVFNNFSTGHLFMKLGWKSHEWTTGEQRALQWRPTKVLQFNHFQWIAAAPPPSPP